MFKIFKVLIILIILILNQDVQTSSHLDYLNLVDRSSLSNYLVKSDARQIVLINTRLVTTYSIKLELLLDSRVKIERVNLF